jgi:nitrogenase-stabilizing/protective protein
MPLTADLSRLSTAEEFFHYLDVPFDPAVLNVSRLHILKKMGQTIARTPLVDMEEPAARELCRDALRTAYADFVARSPLEERVFQVHKKAGGGAGLVPLGAMRR